FKPVVGVGCWACGFPARSDAYQCPHCLWVQPRITRIDAEGDREKDAFRWQGARLVHVDVESLVAPRMTRSGRGRGGGNDGIEPVRVVHDLMSEEGLLRRIATPGPAGPGGADERVARVTMR